MHVSIPAPAAAARLARGNSAGDPRRRAERHRRSVRLRPRPPGPDPALGRRGRSADAAFHHRGRQGLARSRRDFLHLSGRHPRTARGDRALHDARLRRGAGRRGFFARAFLRHHRRHARARHRAQDDGRAGRGGAGAFARLAEFRRRAPAPGARASSCRSIAANAGGSIRSGSPRRSRRRRARSCSIRRPIRPATSPRARNS